MGVSISHNCYSGSCGSFNDWRFRVAEILGYEMVQPAKGRTPYPNIDVAVIKKHAKDGKWENALLGKWETTPEDPIDVLMAHQDFEGIIQVDQLTPLADSLEAILPKLPEEDSVEIMMVWGLRSKTRKFIDGLREAAKEKSAVRFS